jgi:hypothetical protein
MRIHRPIAFPSSITPSVFRARFVILAGFVFLTGWGLTGCGDKKPSPATVVTLKRDGSHFTGSVVRRDSTSITLLSSSGETRTFLNSELSGISAAPPPPPPSSPTPGSQSSGLSPVSDDHAPTPDPSRVVLNGGQVELPTGTEVPVRNNGVLDSCCLYYETVALGNIDSDVKGPGGKVVIPEGANVTIIVRDKKIIDGRQVLEFQLGSTDFGGNHYIIRSAKSELDPGAVVSISGARSASPEAKTRGLGVHLDDRSLMAFKTETPTLVKASQ